MTKTCSLVPATAIILVLLANVPTLAQQPAQPSEVAAAMAKQRERFSGLHQEFDVTQTLKSTDHVQSVRIRIVDDVSQIRWREQLITGSGDRVRLFDGKELFLMEPGGDEFVRVKRKGKDPDPAPAPYNFDLEWAKASELGSQPCAFPSDHVCLTINAPIKGWVRSDVTRVTKMTSGVAQLAFDTETGLIVRCRTQEVIDDGRSPYMLIRDYALARMNYDGAIDEALFKVPENLHEVKQLTPWNLARIKKELIGKPAPALEATDIQGHSVSLSSLKGKTVLLDFWTTWCPPCIGDAPQLDKLYLKYQDKDLVIIGVSVSEERKTVEEFLKTHPHRFPIVLTAENDLPRPYQIGEFPTYMVVAPDGTLTSVAAGGQSFGELRKSLKKAGMDTD